MQAQVAVVRCPDYEYKNVDIAIRKCLELLPKEAIPKNKRVLLKPNLLSSRKGPDKPINTHPMIVEVLAKIIKFDYGCKVYIGDSSGGMSYGQTQRAFSVAGLYQVAKRVGTELVNFENTAVLNLRNENNKIMKEFPVTKFIKDIDFIISLPKLKTHSLVGFTGSVKNMMGVVPGSGKRSMHLAAIKPWQMAQCIIDLYSLVRPDLSIMDAVIGMDGNGPAGGNPKKIGLILAGTDAVALDTVALEIAGYKSKDMEFIQSASERGLGVGDINRIKIAGGDLKEFKIKDFKKPENRVRDYIANFLPEPILKIGFRGMTSGFPVINQILCKRCEICYENCPVKTIERFPDGKLEINHKKCIECYCCHELCPYNAIKIKLPLSSKIIQTGVSVVREILRIRLKPCTPKMNWSVNL